MYNLIFSFALFPDSTKYMFAYTQTHNFIKYTQLIYILIAYIAAADKKRKKTNSVK